MNFRDRDFQLNFLFQTAAEGILLADAGGFLTRINPAAAALLALVRDDVLERPAAEVFKRCPALVHLLTEAGDQQSEVPLPHKRVATGVGMDRPGGGRIVLLHDVTERAAIDSRREALIRSVAHDLRNPLNALLGYADLVAEFGDLTPEQDKYLDRICQTVDKLTDLSERLVDLAWIEAGMALDHKPVELAHLIREAIDDLTPEARERGVTLVISSQAPIPTVMGDPRLLKCMITCLLENGVRYSYPKSNVAIHAWQEGPQMYCSVGDQGIGISQTDLENVWDRLWRSDDERVRRVPGGGIGLTFVRAIAARHGGEVWIESALDVGTTVTFMLPLAEGW
ncbi:MAG: HAMP domain-containing histidine kinase [Anaerolineae bacterium]|nr:HAMP domain-containing histidine kinase [Anaerolineae bacterium]